MNSLPSVVVIAVLGGLASSLGCSDSEGTVFGATTGTGSATGAGGATAGSSASKGAGGSVSTATTGAGGASTSTGAGGCAAQLWYCDRDMDGHGDSKISLESCAMPPDDAVCAGPYVASSDDCGPNDDRAYPAEPDFHGTPIEPPAYSEKYDFDCDGVVTADPAQLFKGTGALACGNQDCFGINPPQGFAKDAECGSVKNYYRCEQPLAQPCAPAQVDAPGPLRCK
jgi:hypothetical protein